MPREVSVSRAVRELLRSRPILLETLYLGVVNYSALARYLRGEVEARLGKRVSEATVKMAVIRFSEEFSREQRSVEQSILNIIARSSLSLIDDIGLLTLRAGEPLSLLLMILEAVTRPRFLQLTQGVSTLTVVADVETVERIMELVDEKQIETVYRNQAAVVLISPKEIIETPGVLSYLTTLLALSGVNLTQIISAHTDTILVIQRDKALSAYRVLSEAIEKARERSGGGGASPTPAEG